MRACWSVVYSTSLPRHSSTVSGCQSRACRAVEGAIVRRLDREPVHRISDGATSTVSISLSPRDARTEAGYGGAGRCNVAASAGMVANGVRPRIVDLGTGTGAIALALLQECPRRQPSDRHCRRCLEDGARQCPTQRLGERFAVRPGPWFEKTPECFDVIVSNPPYIRSEVVSGLEPEVTKFDPIAALDGGADGLDAIAPLQRLPISISRCMA